MYVCDEEGNGVARDGFSPEDGELLGALHEDARELVHQNLLQLVRLFDHDRNADGVERTFNKHFFFLISS